MSLFYNVLFLVIILLFGILLAPFLGGNREGMTDASSNPIDASSNPIDASSNPIDASSNPVDAISNKVDASLNLTTQGSYDNYNHYTGSSTPKLSSSTFYGEDGSSLAVNMNGTNTLTTIDKNGKGVIYTGVPDFDGTIDTFNGPNGSVAIVVDLNNGTDTISVKDTNGNQINYFSTPPPTNPNTVVPNVTPSSTQSTLLPSSSKSTVSSFQNMMSPSSSFFENMSTPSSSFQNVSSQISSFQNMEQPSSTYDYSSSLPPGIPASEIPIGYEDLYILKTEVVPPVCPVCPVQTSINKCPPCPACARCPEPAYDCKLVPNYSSMNANAPVPVLNDFSSFGM